MRLSLLVLFLFFIGLDFYGQKAVVFGVIKDSQGATLPSVNIQASTGKGGAANGAGEYSIEIPADSLVTLKFTFIGQKPREFSFNLKPGERFEQNIVMQSDNTLDVIDIFGSGGSGNLQSIDPKIATGIPSIRGTVEDLLLQAPVNFTSELSSSYSVRGGSFDENLVYVNGIQVYRPFLVRAGQQEGLSFPNTQMIERISFSAGGFEAKYGDKMSSVLDITYRKPKEFGGAFSASLLGASLQLEGISKNKKWSHNSGLRYRDNSYVLGSLDDQGDYRPRYFDFQTYMTFDPDTIGPWEFNFLGTISQNRYNYIPESRETDIGNINEALRLRVFFEGEEITQFRTLFGALNSSYTTDVARFTLTASAFNTVESEHFDILGQYFLDELERDLGSDNFGEILANRGVGGFLEHARNDLTASVLNVAHTGSLLPNKNHFIEWGAKLQAEIIDDELSEWTFLDSAGYNQPRPNDSIGYQFPGFQPDREIILTDVIKAKNELNTSRVTAYIQDTYTHTNEENGNEWSLKVGMRGHYWSFNQQLVGGPRAQFVFEPNWKYKEKGAPLEADSMIRNITFRLSSGMYYQPPFYREMRGIFGEINPDIRAQQAIHFVGGVDYVFKAWDRPFKFTGEIYYKDLNNLIPYEVENVRLRYYGTNNANGYATGLDLMLNGEFIEGVQSWVRASVLKTEEDLVDDQYFEYFNDEGDLIVPGFTLNSTPVDSNLVEPGFIPRPTDQRFSLSLLFQDEMPRWPEYKVLLSVFYGTALPFGPPTFERYKDTERTSAYRRVDIGFSRDLVTAKSLEKPANKRKFAWMKRGSIAIEVFNLLGINNTISHTWIEDVNGRQYGIPNFLTGRRINLKISAEF